MNLCMGRVPSGGAAGTRLALWDGIQLSGAPAVGAH